MLDMPYNPTKPGPVDLSVEYVDGTFAEVVFNWFALSAGGVEYTDTSAEG